MRFFPALLSLIVLGTLHASAQSREDIVLTGGPALRFMEHGKGEVSHDVYWFNFVDASVIRLRELKSRAKPDELVTWLIYRPAYAARSQEMGLGFAGADFRVKAKDPRACACVWFNSQAELIAYLNKGLDRDKTKIADFDYFGHSNKACFLFDYSNTIDTMSIAWLHVKDLRYIDGDIFAHGAMCKSWGCHSGEMYSQWWKSRFDVADDRCDRPRPTSAHGGTARSCPIRTASGPSEARAFYPYEPFALISGLLLFRWITALLPSALGKCDGAICGHRTARTMTTVPPAGGPPPVAPPLKKGSPLDHLANDPKLEAAHRRFQGRRHTSGPVYWTAHRHLYR